jgi:cellulose synthase (UDP-forming)
MKISDEWKKLLALICAKLVLYLILPFYAFFRLYFLVFSDANMPVKLFSAGVFIVELYFIVQTASYLLNFVGSLKHFTNLMGSLKRTEACKKPEVAVLIPIFNEPADIVEATIAAAKRMDYPNNEIYLLDDSDRPGIINEMDDIAARYDVRILRRTSRIGFKAGSLNDAIAQLPCDYITVLDSDQQVEPDFLSRLIPILEADADLGYLQTPQSVRPSSEGGCGFIERGAAATQNVFYNYVCEGKGVVNAQFSCGSNVVYRRKALESIRHIEGGRIVYMDEWCVTEDYATSILLQGKGWKSLYYTGTCARGLVPVTLGAFSAQRKRWAVGTLSVFWRYASKILFGDFSLRQKWEYLSSGSYFLIGVANFLMLLNIAILILFNIPTYATFLPPILFVSNMVTFYFSQHIRGNKAVDLFYEQALNYLIFPVYIEAFLTVVSGKKIAFSVTSKKRTKEEGPPDLRIQEATLLCCFAILIIGIRDYSAAPSYYMLLNIFWLVYSMVLLGLGILFVRMQGKGEMPSQGQEI